MWEINLDCIACGICKESFPEDAIEEGNIYKIDEKHCIECGRCYENCPNNAIKPPIGF